MNSSPVASPSNLPPVRQRDIHFPIQGVDLRRWHPAGLQVTHTFNALQIFFPEGEKFFIETVRRYRDRITDPALSENLQGFIGQEAMHGREHRVYNAALAAEGYPIARLEQEAIRELNLARQMLPPSGQLAITIALEHYTAIMADALLSDPRVLAGAAPEMVALWRWHAIEETEHKAVAYDVYQAMVGGGLRGYLLRCSIMISVTIRFWYRALRNILTLVKRDGGLRDWKAWRHALHFQFVSPGPFRHILLPWLAYFRPGFHPWQQDNRHHVERWKAEYAARHGG